MTLTAILHFLLRNDRAVYVSELDARRASGIGVDLKTRKRVAEFVGVKI
jgi:hypothetical protein